MCAYLSPPLLKSSQTLSPRVASTALRHFWIPSTQGQGEGVSRLRSPQPSQQRYGPAIPTFVRANAPPQHSEIFNLGSPASLGVITHLVVLLLDPRAGEEGMALSNAVIFFLMALPCDSRLSFVKLFPLLLVFECCRVFVFTSLSNHFPSDEQDTSPPPHPNLFSSCFWSLRPQGAKIFRVFSSESRFYMVFSGVKAQVPLKFHSLL